MAEVTDPRILQRIQQQKAQQGAPIVIGQPDPTVQTKERRAESDDAREAARLGITVEQLALQRQQQGFQQGNTNYDNLTGLRNTFNNLQAVKDYKAVVPILMQGLQSARNPQGDLSLIYAYAKVMDPGSVVREAEQEMAGGTAGFWDQKVEQFKKALGYDNARGLPENVANGLRQEMNRKVAQLAKSYGVERLNAQEFAKSNGMDPQQVVGRPPFEPFVDKYLEIMPGADQSKQGKAKLDPNEAQSTDEDRRIAAVINAARKGGATFDDLNDLHQKLGRGPLGDDVRKAMEMGREDPFAPAKSQQPSIMQKAVTGAAENPFGSATLAYGNAALGGIPTMIAGQDNIDVLRDANPWSTLAGEIGGGITGTFGAGAGLKGVSKIAAPSIAKLLGNPITADVAYNTAYGGATSDDPVAGALLGGGLSLGVGGLTNRVSGALSRRAAENEAMALVPTVPELKSQAETLYSAAENSGQLLDPTQTQALADDFRGILSKEGVISPSGRLSEVHPKVKEALLLADEYAGNTMNPTQMQTVRDVVSTAVRSADPDESRVARALRQNFDGVVDPLVPELAQGRQTAAKYLQAQELEKARELAGASAGAYSGSGFENALRSQYRRLDKGIVNGQEFFDPAVVDAIKDVGRGTTASNVARGLGKMAPTGVVSGGFGLGMGGLGGMVGGPVGAITLGGGSMGVGAVSRKVATALTDRNALIAEAIARNGGSLPLDMRPVDFETLLMGSLVSPVPGRVLAEDDEKRADNQKAR
jgi:hypothetical protein